MPEPAETRSVSEGRAMKRLAAALVLSAVFHAGVLAATKPKPVPVKTPEPPPAVELEVVEVEPPPVPVEAPKVEAPAKLVKRRAAPVHPEPVVVAEPQSSPSEVEGPVAVADAPRDVTLVPKDPAVALPLPELPKGTTVRNRPEELPDPAALLAYEADTVHRRVDGWAQQTLAAHRVRSGVVSHYFHDLRHRLEDVTKEPPAFIDPISLKSLPDHGQQAARAWKAGAERYGKTGSAYEKPDDYSGLHGVAISEAEKGGEQATRFAASTTAAARLRDFGDGKMGEELIAIVELKQGTNGALADLALIQPSSSIRFDTWVMAQAPKALDGLTDPPDAGVGIHPHGMRSIWAFKGRISYKRSVKDAKLLEDGWYVALMAVPGLLTGNFDEVTGQMDYVDLRHPHYECRVQLLEVY